MKNTKELVAQMTLEEKAGMCSGYDFWHLKGVERLGIPKIMVADGPHGLRKQDESSDHLGINDSIKAVCFPSAAGLSSSFDRELLKSVGETLGEECQAEKVAVILGPAINIKRSPLCGRNFEYMSEDPYLAGELSASYIEGVQSKNIGTSVKHYAVNNQEKRRSTVSAEIGERALREIYLAGFETAIKKSKPWTVMCSYNRINGEYVAQSKKLLNDILREEWGFEGCLVTDWSACDKRVEGLLAGQDLEMPDSGGANDRLIAEAVRIGILKEEVLNQAVERILNVVYGYTDCIEETAVFDREEHHKLAKIAACQSMVLLKNELLPLKKGKTYAFLGPFAKEPRYQGGGSSHINAYRVTNAYEECQDLGEIHYAKGFDLSGKEEKELITEAVALAKTAEAAVIFAGLTEDIESEAYDREHMDLPENQKELIRAVTAVQKNTVVVLHNGSPVEMPWMEDVSAILESYLAGEAVGEAQRAILFGEENPCGKLAETFPIRVEDNPSWLDFAGEKDQVCYHEGIYVGYRYYDKKKMKVLFPFGHGLSYTKFTYSNLKLSTDSMKNEDLVIVEFTVKNTGKVKGKEVTQLYVGKDKSNISRAPKELKGIEAVTLLPGEEKSIVMTLDRRSFAYFNEEKNGWEVEPGEYQILVGASSRDIRLQGKITREDDPYQNWHCHRNTPLGDIKKNKIAHRVYLETLEREGLKSPFANMGSLDSLGAGMRKMADAMMNDSPLRALRSFYKGKIDDAFIERLVDTINKAVDNEK